MSQVGFREIVTDFLAFKPKLDARDISDLRAWIELHQNVVDKWGFRFLVLATVFLTLTVGLLVHLLCRRRWLRKDAYTVVVPKDMAA